MRNDELLSRPFFNRRLLVAMAAVLVAFLLLMARAWYLQVLRYDSYHALAEDNRITMLPLPPQRGRILDRHGVVLAEDVHTPALEISPSQAGNIDALLKELGQIVSLSPGELRRFRRQLASSRSTSGTIPLKSRLTDQEAARIAAERYRLDGVEIKARPRRNYPLGSTAAHAIGYIGRISATDNEWLARHDLVSEYAGSTHIGKLGLEQGYEALLHGKVGIEEVEVTASGRPVRSLSKQPALPGRNLRLSIDIRLQQMAEKLFGDYKGALVAIEPASGEILAFVSMPSFDPNLFVDGIDQQRWQALNGDPARPLLNRPLRGTYPPGSTYKPFMALAILENGVRKPEDTITDPGYFMLGKHRFRDSKPQGHGRVDLKKSIVVSSDTYYYGASYELGVDRIHHFMQQWRFGSLTGIDLPDEVPGILPSSQWKKARFKQPWYPGETPSVGIGQGYNAFTILQLAHATAVLANDAVPVRPHLVTHVDDQPQPQAGPRPGTALRVQPQHVRLVQKAMHDVTTRGTARIAFANAGYASAGKTGTAQVIGIAQNERYDEKRIARHFRDHSLYIGYAPFENPRIALALIVENGGFGARTAAPIARKLFDFYLLGQEPAELAPPTSSNDAVEADSADGQPSLETGEAPATPATVPVAATLTTASGTAASAAVGTAAAASAASTAEAARAVPAAARPTAAAARTPARSSRTRKAEAARTRQAGPRTQAGPVRSHARPAVQPPRQPAARPRAPAPRPATARPLQEARR